jgi:hypothetical protein
MTETIKTNFAGLSRDIHNNPLQLSFAKAALAVTNDTSISSSTQITLNENTSLIEVTAIDGNVFLKYGTDNATSSAFDEFIIAGATRHYVIPSGVTAINLIDNGDSAKVIVIEK